MQTPKSHKHVTGFLPNINRIVLLAHRGLCSQFRLFTQNSQLNFALNSDPRRFPCRKIPKKHEVALRTNILEWKAPNRSANIAEFWPRVFLGGLSSSPAASGLSLAFNSEIANIHSPLTSMQGISDSNATLTWFCRAELGIPPNRGDRHAEQHNSVRFRDRR